jgi:hypothetical protein
MDLEHLFKPHANMRLGRAIYGQQRSDTHLRNHVKLVRLCTLIDLNTAWPLSTPFLLLPLARIIHEGFYYNRRYAVPTGVLATQSVNILFKYASLIFYSIRPSTPYFAQLPTKPIHIAWDPVNSESEHY